MPNITGGHCVVFQLEKSGNATPYVQLKTMEDAATYYPDAVSFDNPGKKAADKYTFEVSNYETLN